MKKSTTALSLAALIAAGGIYYTSTTLASAFATEPDQLAADAAHATALASNAVFVAVPGTSAVTTPLTGLAPVAVEDKRAIRCYYRADLSSEYQIEGSSNTPRRPSLGQALRKPDLMPKPTRRPKIPTPDSCKWLTQSTSAAAYGTREP